jgi:hypothetical protein
MIVRIADSHRLETVDDNRAENLINLGVVVKATTKEIEDFEKACGAKFPDSAYGDVKIEEPKKDGNAKAISK